MKNITKFLGACAAVALFSACSNEEVLAPSEDQVPNGKHKVTLTVKDNVTTDETGKKRAHLNMEDGEFYFDGVETDCVAVIYRNPNDQNDKEIIQFMRADLSLVYSDPDYENRVCKSCEFVATIDDEILNTKVPTDVYGYYGGFHLTEDDYKEVPQRQYNIEGNYIRENEVEIDFIQPHLHGIAQPSSQYTFTATLSMDNAALIHIDGDDMPEKPDDYDDCFHVKVDNKTYDVYVGWRYSSDIGITFTVEVPEEGIEDPVFEVTGKNDATETLVTKSHKPLKPAKRYKLQTTRTTGTAQNSSRVNVPWVQLWEDGPKFAEYNVGASQAEDFGGYYFWGGIEENKTGYSCQDDSRDDIGTLSSTYDAATKKWGKNWRLPTDTELEQLLANTSQSYATQNGVQGLLCSGKSGSAYESNKIFLPAAGYGSADYRGDFKVNEKARCGYYLSSTASSATEAKMLWYDNYYYSYKEVKSFTKTRCYSVRAVLNK